MLIALHPALNQLIGVMLGMALAVGDVAGAQQEQHLPILYVAASAGAKVIPDATHTADIRPVRRNDPATRDRDLTLAAQTGSTVAIQSLLAKGAGLKAHDAGNRTTPIATVTTHMGAAARLLVQAGADVNLQDNTQNSTFLFAASQGDMETACLALSHDANLRATNADGDTAFILATRRGYVEVVSELVKANVLPDVIDNLGLTVLIEAITLGGGSDKYGKAVRVLLDGEADPNLTSRGGITPVQHAHQRGLHGIGALLSKTRGH